MRVYRDGTYVLMLDRDVVADIIQYHSSRHPECILLWVRAELALELLSAGAVPFDSLDEGVSDLQQLHQPGGIPAFLPPGQVVVGRNRNHKAVVQEQIRDERALLKVICH
ncbi:hypothetical protein AV521_40650 [Streptomyces sp. IMTB 2501]|nr:hypothetical protein AV521_40650 [Streptomyces sp. IMTB 2501]